MYLGRRIWYVKRALSNIFGARKEHDRLPKRMMTPLEEGPSAGSVPDMDLMLREFYELRKFNENGVPSREVLEELDLLELVDLLYRD
jgi:aldehyde:ferredoxin oxidoreductase